MANGYNRQSKALDILKEILSDDRLRTSAHFSSSVYHDEPILTTGRQMKNYLPERYRQMKGISRYEPGRNGAPGRWLAEAELFWRQARFMEDFEDDCPYHGEFKASYPTYNAMSDQQLRGYFTWRAAVRRGDVQKTSLSFAYVYLYELINGIGVASPLEGFGAIGRFWQAYRAFAPELDGIVPLWLRDHVVYHGLDRSLLTESRTYEADAAIIALKRAMAQIAAAGAETPVAGTRGRAQKAPAIPLPANVELEDELFGALNALSSYNLEKSRFHKAYPADLRHVTCAVFVRLGAHYDKRRAKGLVESWFGEMMELSYTMFGTAVFFEAAPHPDTVYVLDEVCRYRCQDGLWTCERFYGDLGRNRKLGSLLRAVDRTMRAARAFPYPLKDDGKTPKYVQKIIDDEVAAWAAWQEAHRPVKIDIDLSQLEGIRNAAASTREALLVDEERAVSTEPHHGARPSGPLAAEATDADVSVAMGTAAPRVPKAASAMASGAGGNAAGNALLAPPQIAYLQCLVCAAPAGERQAAVAASGLSEDMLVDAVNEALFDFVGDTVIEFGAAGPALVEDYQADVKELMAHGQD